MSQGKHKTVRERKAAEGRLFRSALLVSLLIHALVFAFWKTVPIPQSPFAAAGPRAGDFRAAAGGGMQAMNLAVPPPRPIIPPRVPLISLEMVEPVEINLEPQPDLADLIGDGPGLDEGPGIEGGTGRGDGGTASEGFFRMVPPSPRGMIIPPTNKSLRGSQVEVWVFVNERGRVVPDSTRLNPPTSDRGFNRRLIEEASEWVFNPAMMQGKPVAAWFPYTISM
ncbi:MAG: hypothetical protein ACWGSQ_12840 [Longimicrobiales bacterium]